MSEIKADDESALKVEFNVVTLSEIEPTYDTNNLNNNPRPASSRVSQQHITQLFNY